MNIKSTIILFLLFAIACNRPLTEEQKNSDAVFYKIKKEYILNTDGSYTFKYYHKLLYNSYFSFHRIYGESFIIYNPEFQTLKVTKSVTRMADGKVVKSPSNAFNEVLPGQAADAPAYNKLREMVVTHVGLEIGAIVELEYELETKPGFMPFFADRVNFYESSPIQDYEVIISIPESESLNHKVTNKPDDLDYVKRSAKNKKIYAWKARNLSAVSHEPMQPEGMADYPVLTFSTVDLDAAFNYLKSNLTNGFVPDKSSQLLLEDNLKGWEKVNSLKNLVVSNMNTYGVQPQFVGYKFRSPEQVWKSNGGTEGEKAILLSALLKNAGFSAQTVLAGYPHILNGKIGYPGAFDKYLVKVEFQGETRYYSMIDDHVKYPGARSVIGINEDITSLSYENQEPGKRKSSLKTSLIFSGDGILKGTSELTLNSYDDSKPLISLNPSSFTSEKVIEKIDTIVYRFTIGNSGIKAIKNENYYYFELPAISQGLSSLRLGELPTERTTSLELPGKFNESYDYSFILPDGIKFISPENETVVENNLGFYKIKTTVDGSKVAITRSIEINQHLIKVDDYNNFREIMSLWLDKKLNTAVFKAEY